MVTCTACPAGRYGLLPDAAAQLPLLGSSACTGDCPAGYFSLAGAVTGCTACPAGKHSAAAATKDACADCASGRSVGRSVGVKS